jgi:hypothetical protein
MDQIPLRCNLLLRTLEQNKVIPPPLQMRCTISSFPTSRPSYISSLLHLIPPSLWHPNYLLSNAPAARATLIWRTRLCSRPHVTKLRRKRAIVCQRVFEEHLHASWMPWRNEHCSNDINIISNSSLMCLLWMAEIEG